MTPRDAYGAALLCTPTEIRTEPSYKTSDKTAMGIFIDPVELPKGGDGACQLIFLLLVYG